MPTTPFSNATLALVLLALPVALVGCASKSDAAPGASGAENGGAGVGGAAAGGAGNTLAGAPAIDFSNIPVSPWAAGIMAVSDGKPIIFYPAVENGATGDYMGDGAYVAQIAPVPNGTYQADLLHAFSKPGDTPLAVLQGTASGNTISFTGGGWTGELKDGVFSGQNGAESFSLNYFEHASPTLGKKPPDGAVILFDGTNLDAWAKKGASNWLQTAGAPAWALVDGGAVEVVPGMDGIITKQSFGDIELHLEYRTLGSPTNSGLLLQARYESNINETYGLFGKSAGGGFDNCTPAASKLQVRATRPPLAWQTLDISFTAPRFDAANTKIASASATVDLNGVRIYEGMQLDPPTGAAQRLGESATGPLMLQEHGMKLQFRNIWLLEGSH